MTTGWEETEMDAIADRIHALIAPHGVESEALGKVDAALRELVDQEHRRMERLHLVEARQHRSAVAALVDLLLDIEEISSSETDRTVFEEMAHLFDDIAMQARLGSEALRRLHMEGR